MNYEFKGTPGPWRWEVNEKHKDINICGGKPLYDQTVLSFDRWGMHSAEPCFNNGNGELTEAHHYTIAVKGREHHKDWFKGVDHPDAHLIASAPCLLEALKSLMDYPEEDLKEWANGTQNIVCSFQPCHIKQALDAIHKALNINQ